MESGKPVRRRRLWRRLAVALVVVLVAAALGVGVGLPAWLNSASGRHWLLTRANRALAPSKLEVATFRFSWFGPTRMTGFQIIDAQGDRVVDSPRAHWSPRLFQALFDEPRYGTLTLDGAAVDVERFKDGTIDLVEALRPILAGTPETDFTIRVVAGTFRIRSPGLAEPLTAEHFDLMIRRPAEPGAVSWSAALGKGAKGQLLVRGDFDRPGGPNQKGARPLTIVASARSWPLALVVAGKTVRGMLDAQTTSRLLDGPSRLDGQAELNGLEVGLKADAEPLRLARVAASWDVERIFNSFWNIKRLDVDSPLGTVHAQGPPTGNGFRLEGALDLAASSRLLGEALGQPEGFGIDKGRAEWTLASTLEPGRDAPQNWQLDAKLVDLAARRGETTLAPTSATNLHGTAVFDADGVRFQARTDTNLSEAGGPLALACEGDYRRSTDRATLRQLTVRAAGVEVSASGTLDDLANRRRVALEGTLNPDWKALNDRLAERAGSQATISGEAGPLKLSGSLADGVDKLNGEFGVRLTKADVFGLRVGATPINVRYQGGKFTLDPIDTTLNGGRLHLAPELARNDTGWEVRLPKGPVVEDAEVNDEVSHRVLAYVAPSLDQATRTRGRVSMAVDRAVFPIGEGASKKAVVEGKMVFRDVEFAPGPMTAEVLDVIGRSDATLKLNQPVTLAIHDGRVFQQGLAIPIGRITQIEMAGSVGFDKTLDLTVALPITAQMFGNQDVFAGVIDVPKLSVPVHGTLDDPKLDKEAFREGIAQMGKSLATRGAIRGIAGLMELLSRPRDPNAPPPPPRLTPEERRAKQQEKKDQMRERREERKRKRQGGA